MDITILEAEKRKAYLSGDEDLIRAYEMREMALSDLVSMENYAREKGYSEGHAAGHAAGHAKGREEERQRIFDLLNQGMSVEDIKRQL